MLMEFCKEGDLFDFVERPGLTRQRRWLLFTQIALGVAHMVRNNLRVEFSVKNCTYSSSLL